MASARRPKDEAAPPISQQGARRTRRPQTRRPSGKRRPATQRYVTSLDGFRSLCALGVVAYHMRLSWCQGGLLGVTVLFVLAGYLTTAGLLREFRQKRGHINLLDFIKRRVLRLMPTVLVFVAVTGAVMTFFNHALFTKMRPDILPSVFMYLNWAKILGHESYFAAAGAPSPLTHFWSLAIETQFYLIWPPIFYLLMRLRVPRRNVGIGLLVASVLSAALMAVLYVPGADPSRVYYGTDTRAFSLLLGCWLALVWPFDRMSVRQAGRLKGVQRTVVMVVGPLCLAGLVAMMLFTEGYTSFSYYGGMALCSLLSVGIIAALVPEGSLMARFFSFKPLEWIGKRSYAIYLWHYPILELMNPLTATTGIPWWKLLLELVLILVVSELSYRFVETPLRSLGKKAEPAKEVPQRQGKGSRRGSRRQDPRKMGLRALPAWAPAAAVMFVGTLITVIGLIVVEPVTVAGDNPNEKRVMQASLRKPLQDGVYDVVLIGDSVSLGANEQLNAAFPHGMIDTRGERQVDEAIEVLEGYLEQGVVGDQVVISIGTNGVLSHESMDTILKDVGSDRQLWFVNMRSPNAKDVDNNALIDEYVAANENVHLIDWYSATQGHDEWLIEDGIHLTWEGRDAYTKLVVDTMGYVLPNDTNTKYDVTILGDTVCLDAADYLAQAFPQGLVDTSDGRMPADVAKTYKDYADQGVVGSAVVVAIGNEESLQDKDLEAIVNAVGDDKDLWLVNVRMPGAWCAANNKLIERVASEHPRAHVIDWYGASEGHDDWLREDGTHLTDAGAKAYTQLVSENVTVAAPASSDAAQQTEQTTEGELDTAA